MNSPLRLAAAVLRDTFLWLAIASAGCSGSSPPSKIEGSADASSDGAEIIFDAGDEAASPPDGVSLCPQGTCNYQSGVGCPTDAGPVSCVPLGDPPVPSCETAGSVPFGGACTQWTDCVSGSICVAGTCRKLCCGKDWTGCTNGQHCYRQLAIPAIPASTPATFVPTQAYLCLPVNNCDPLMPKACPDPTTECQLVDPTGAVACLPAGTGDLADACDNDSPCKGGLVCVGGGCRRLCRAEPGGSPACPPAEGICEHWKRDPEGVGECTPN